MAVARLTIKDNSIAKFINNIYICNRLRWHYKNLILLKF